MTVLGTGTGRGEGGKGGGGGIPRGGEDGERRGQGEVSLEGSAWRKPVLG